MNYFLVILTNIVILVLILPKLKVFYGEDDEGSLAVIGKRFKNKKRSKQRQNGAKIGQTEKSLGGSPGR